MIKCDNTKHDIEPRACGAWASNAVLEMKTSDYIETGGGAHALSAANENGHMVQDAAGHAGAAASPCTRCMLFKEKTSPIDVTIILFIFAVFLSYTFFLF